MKITDLITKLAPCERNKKFIVIDNYGVIFENCLEDTKNIAYLDKYKIEQIKAGQTYWKIKAVHIK